MTVQSAPASTVGNRVWLLLGGTANETFTAGPVNLFRGRVTDPPVHEDGRVENYAVLYDTPGHLFGTRMGSTRHRFTGTFQVTAVGPDPESCLWVVDRVTGLLAGALVTLDGLARPRRILDDPSNQSRAVTPDEDVQPPRWFVPLLFTITT